MIGCLKRFLHIGPKVKIPTAKDTVMTTRPGDIVLYAGDQISVFYGPNTWSYTKLGRITDRTEEELTELLGNGNVTMTLILK